MKKITWIILIFTGVLTAALAGLWVYIGGVLRGLERKEDGGAIAGRHYAFITEDTSDLWRAVYESASVQAAAGGDVLEWVGEGDFFEYTTRDRMQIATASGVDGIILYKKDLSDMTDLIEEAEEAGIPVVTVLSDNSDSSRISYVGISSYEAGELLGREAAKAFSSGENSVMVLMDAGSGEGTSSLVFSTMLSAAEREKAPDATFTFRAVRVNTASGFEAEEDIRDIFVGGDPLPDILICLDQVSTECVSQALVDYNQVGNVEVIGYYGSETVLRAVEKGVVRATLGIDTERIGISCIEALDEYYTLGIANNYYSVPVIMIDGDNADAFLAAVSGEEEAEEQT